MCVLGFFLSTRIFPHPPRYFPTATPPSSSAARLPNPAPRTSPSFPSTRGPAEATPIATPPGDARRPVRGDSQSRGHYPACPATRWQPEGSGPRKKVCCGLGVVGPGGRSSGEGRGALAWGRGGGGTSSRVAERKWNGGGLGAERKQEGAWVGSEGP